jgi:hypothetical protein
MQLSNTDLNNNLEKLRYRRQFILGPESMEPLPTWHCAQITSILRLSVHPDLELCKTTKGSKSLILLGYILDPNIPEATNHDILEALIDKFDTFEDIFKQINDFGGRWILFVQDGEESILLHDAAGLRQVYYSLADTIWCASETGLLANALNLQFDSEAVAQTKIKDCRIWGVYWWPGDTSAYKEVKILLPNHFLNLQTGSVHRYWPNTKIKDLTFQDGVAQSAHILRSLIKSAQLRYELALSCTAGWDSRLMLAACKDVKEHLYCFTVTYDHYTKHTPDLLVPTVLLKKLGLKLNVLPYAENISSSFEKLFNESSPSIDPEGFADIQALFEQYPHKRLCISGDVAEITKCYYKSHQQSHDHIDAFALADISNMGRYPFALGAYDRWLASVNNCTVNILDLFCWEQLAGRWQARKGGTFDFVHESFNPYNCRTLIEIMLGVDEKYRQPPDYVFHKELIATLWNEVLSEPINPPEKSTKIALKNILVKLHLFHLFKKLK